MTQEYLNSQIQSYVSWLLKPGEMLTAFVETETIKPQWGNRNLQDILNYQQQIAQITLLNEEDWSGLVLTTQRCFYLANEILDSVAQESLDDTQVSMKIEVYETPLNNVLSIKWAALWGILKIKLKSPDVTIDCNIWGDNKQQAKSFAQIFAQQQTNTLPS